MNRPTARELLRWGDLDAQRRRQARGFLGLVSSAPFVAVSLSLLLAFDVWRRFDSADPNIGGLGFSLIAITVAQVLVVFGTPYRMYWRDDSALLGRLAIDGRALFRLACVRTWRAAGLALLPALAAVVVVAIVASTDVAIRVAIVSFSCAALAGLMAPAACLAGGAIVASDRAQSLIDSFAGEAKPPGVAWLGALPGFVATAVALLVIIVREWIALGSPLISESAILCATAIALSIAAHLWASKAAPRVLLEAQREVAALDQERLAHIDRSVAGPIERLWGAITVRGVSSRLVYDKDAALMRRRYPAPTFVAFLGIVASWILAATSQPGATLVVVCCLAAYCAVMARRHATAPVERRRLIETLPLARGAAAAAKRSATTLRALMWVALPAASVVLFAKDPVAALVVPLAAVAFALGAGLALVGLGGTR